MVSAQKTGHRVRTDSASPIHAEGRIYFLSEQGESVVIQAGREFKIIARNSIGEKCQASYGVSQRQIFIRSEKNLFCIGEPADNRGLSPVP